MLYQIKTIDKIIKITIEHFYFISTAHEIDRLRKHKTAHKIHTLSSASFFLHQMKVIYILRTCFYRDLVERKKMRTLNIFLPFSFISLNGWILNTLTWIFVLAPTPTITRINMQYNEDMLCLYKENKVLLRIFSRFYHINRCYWVVRAG